MWTSFLKRPKFRVRNTAQLSVQVSAPKSGRSSFESLGALRSARSRSGPGFGDGMRARSLGRGLALGRPCTVRFLQENKAFTHMHWLLSASPRPRFLGRIPSPKAGPLFEPWVCFLSNRGSAFSSRARAAIHSSEQARGPEFWAAFRPRRLGRIWVRGPASLSSRGSVFKPSSNHKLFKKLDQFLRKAGPPSAPELGRFAHPLI